VSAESGIFGCLGVAFGLFMLAMAFGKYMELRHLTVFNYRTQTAIKYGIEATRDLPDWDTMKWQLFKWSWDEYLPANVQARQ
jgi:hypothetical protein